MRRIPLSAILYAATVRRAVEVHTTGGVWRTYMTFDEAEAQLADPRFVCCSRGVLVNLDQVKVMEGQDFLLYTGERLPISRAKRAEMKEAYTARLFSGPGKGACDMVELILNILTMSLPYPCPGLLPIPETPPAPWAAVLGLIFASEAVVRAAVYLVGLDGGNSRALEFILFPICAVIFFCCTRMEPSKLLFFYLFVTDHITIVRGLTVFVLARLLAGQRAVFPARISDPSGIFCGDASAGAEGVVRDGEADDRCAVPRGLWRTIWISPDLLPLSLGYTYDIGESLPGA